MSLKSDCNMTQLVVFKFIARILQLAYKSLMPLTNIIDTRFEVDLKLKDFGIDVQIKNESNPFLQQLEVF